MERSRLYTPEYFKINLVSFLLFTCVAFFFLLPVYIERLGGSRVMIGLTMGSCEAAAVTSRLFFGKRMDRIGRRKVLLAGAALTMLASFLFALAGRAGLLQVLLRIMLGAGYGAVFTATFTIVAELSPPERLAEGLGTLGVSPLLAHGFGPWLGMRIVLAHGFRALFIAGGLFSALALVLALFLRESRSPDFCLEYRIDYGRSLKGALGSILLITFLYAAGRGAIISFFSDFAYDRGLENIGAFFVCFSASAVATRLFAGRIIDRVGRARMLAPSLALFSAGLFHIAFIHSPSGVIAGGVLCGLGQALLYPVLMSLAVEKAGACDRGATTGMYTAVFDAGLGFGSFFWGGIANYFGYAAMYITASLTAASGILLRRKVGQGAGN